MAAAVALEVHMAAANEPGDAARVDDAHIQVPVGAPGACHAALGDGVVYAGSLHANATGLVALLGASEPPRVDSDGAVVHLVVGILLVGALGGFLHL